MEPSFFGMQACCFTGHRPNGLPVGDLIRLRALCAGLDGLVRAAADAGVTRFYAGGALGFDTMAARAVLCLGMERPKSGIALHLALPSPRQAELWSAADRDEYDWILSQAAVVWYASPAGAPDTAAMQARNRYLVEHADACIAYCTKNSGGTAYTVRYAKRRGIPIYNLAERMES